KVSLGIRVLRMQHKKSLVFKCRINNVFFSGCLNRNRLSWFSALAARSNRSQDRMYSRIGGEIRRRLLLKRGVHRVLDDRFQSSYIRFTQGFSQGLAAIEYAAMLANTKIAVCPPGFVSHETIRHWEAMRLGCVIISGQLPPNRFYRGSPIIQISNWANAPAMIDELLADPSELQALHFAMARWWRDVASEEAVANQMIRVINPTLNPS
ncbi:MAG: hypothetical protein ACNA8L_12385, partial [Luteolibacter sp.]